MKKRLILPILLVITLFVSAQTGLPTYLPQEGLVGWWPFTGNANDSSGKNNNGIITGASLTADRFGRLNNAYSFNGVNTWIDIPDNASLRCRKLTLSAWVYNKNTTKTSQVIYKGSLNAEGEAYSLNCIGNLAGSSVKVESNCIPAAGWSSVKAQHATIQNSWEHFAATFDGSSYKIYRNGLLDSSVSLTGLIDSCLGGNVRIGFNHTRYPNNDGFIGYIDDVGIWNRELTQSEILQLYSGTVSCGNGNMGINVCNPQRNLHVSDVMRLEPRATEPLNPGKGDIYFDGTFNKLRVYDGTQWQNCW